MVVALAASRGASAGGGAKSNSGGGTGDANDRVEALHTEASLLFLDLRAANRATLESVDASREAAREAKRELDDQRLLLQNVQYEKGHVRKEIRTSSEFVSEFPDEKVGLCDAETFFAEMATNVGSLSSDEKRDVTEENEEENDSVESLRALDAHALTLKRLAHELRRREALVRRRDALEQKKTALTRTNAADRLFLDGLRGELGALRTAVEPLRMKLSSGNRRGTTSSDGFSPTSSGTYARRRFCATRRFRRRCTCSSRRSSASPSAAVLKRVLKNENGRVVRDGRRGRGGGGGRFASLEALEESAGENGEDDEDPDGGGRKRKRAPSHDEGAEAMDGKDFGKNKQRAQTKETETTASTRIVPAPGAHEAHETRVVLRLGADEYGGSITFRYFPSLRVVTAEVRGSSSHVRESTLLVDCFRGTTGRAPSASVEHAAAANHEGESVCGKTRPRFCHTRVGHRGLAPRPPVPVVPAPRGLGPAPARAATQPRGARASVWKRGGEKSFLRRLAAAERAVAARTPSSVAGGGDGGRRPRGAVHRRGIARARRAKRGGCRRGETRRIGSRGSRGGRAFRGRRRDARRGAEVSGNGARAF